MTILLYLIALAALWYAVMIACGRHGSIYSITPQLLFWLAVIATVPLYVAYLILASPFIVWSIWETRGERR